MSHSYFSSRFSTRAIHVGQIPDPLTGAVVPPLHLASTFSMDEVGVSRNGYDYGRGGNPTRDAFQKTLASLEGAQDSRAFPAGLAAEDSLLRVLTRPGQHISFGSDVYGGTFRLIDSVMAAEGRTSSALNLHDLGSVARDLEQNRSRVLWVETPSNPLLNVFDIVALGDVAHSFGALLIVDNTFASPYLQQPLSLGADLVTHSTTKYIGGHSDLVGGAVVVKDGLELPEGVHGWTDSGLVLDELTFLQTAVGSIPSPTDAYLAARGLKTLALRVQRQSETAQTIAEFLHDDPRVQVVHYPGLPSDPGHELGIKQMRAFGGVLSFQVSSEEAALRVCESTAIFGLAVSLGAAESLIEHPARMTHGTKAASDSAISPRLVRLAIGLEDPQDLLEDLDQALGGAR